MSKNPAPTASGTPSPSSQPDNDNWHNIFLNVSAAIIVVRYIVAFWLFLTYASESSRLFIIPLAPLLAAGGLTLLYFSFPTSCRKLHYYGLFLRACVLFPIPINLFVRYYASAFSFVLYERHVDEINYLMADISTPTFDPSLTDILPTLFKTPVYRYVPSVSLAEYCSRLIDTDVGSKVLSRVYYNQTSKIPYIFETIRAALMMRLFETAMITTLGFIGFRIFITKGKLDWFITSLPIPVTILMLPIVDIFISDRPKSPFARKPLLPNFCGNLVENYGTFFTGHAGRDIIQGGAIAFVSVCTLLVMLMGKPASALSKHWLAEYAAQEFYGYIFDVIEMVSICFSCLHCFTGVLSLKPSSFLHLYQSNPFRTFLFVIMLFEYPLVMRALRVYFPRMTRDTTDSTATEGSALPPLQNNHFNRDNKPIEDTSQALLDSSAEVPVYTSLTFTQESQESVVDGAPNSSTDSNSELLEHAEVPKEVVVGSLTTDPKQRPFLMREHKNAAANVGCAVLLALFMYALDTYFVWSFSLRFFSNDRWLEPASFMFKVVLYSIVLGFMRYGDMFISFTSTDYIK